jgi:predicted nucleic acid-binding protein
VPDGDVLPTQWKRRTYHTDHDRSDVARVFVDTNVLFPFSVMDLMLALTEDAIHEVIWTESLLAEWEQVIVREHMRTPESAAAVTAAIREFFTESQVPEGAYAHLVDEMPSKDPDDRRHIAAAVAGGASAIVTWNCADFPAEPLAALGLQVIDPDMYLCELLTRVPEETVATVVRLAGEKRKPPLTPLDFSDRLAKAGVGTFAARIRGLLGEADFWRAHGGT